MVRSLEIAGVTVGPAVIGGVVVGVLVSVKSFRLFFDRGEFLEAVRFHFQPDWLSMARGELSDDWRASFKLGAWVFLSILSGIGAFAGIERLLS